MHSVSGQAWVAAIKRRWPQWAAIAGADGKVCELLAVRQGETGRIPDVQAIRRVQTVINERHRAILAEWLAEVSIEWELDSDIVFEAVAYLDFYLSKCCVEKLARFQLLGLGCLRMAMCDHRATLSDAAQMLDAEKFAFICDDAYTAEEVDESTKALAAAVPLALRQSPNAKMLLRTLWYRARERGVVANSEMHVYTAASFLLQLALLDLPCAAFPPTQLAAAALSLALEAFDKPAWPAALQRFSAYETADLEAPRRRLAVAQASQDAPQLRYIWQREYEEHGHNDGESGCGDSDGAPVHRRFRVEWGRVLAIMERPSRLLPDVGPERPPDAAVHWEAPPEPPVPAETSIPLPPSDDFEAEATTKLAPTPAAAEAVG